MEYFLHTVLEYFNLKDADLPCKLSFIVFDEQLFSTGDIIVVGFSNDEYVLGLTEFVLSFKEGICFLYEKIDD